MQHVYSEHQSRLLLKLLHRLLRRLLLRPLLLMLLRLFLMILLMLLLCLLFWILSVLSVFLSSWRLKGFSALFNSSIYLWKSKIDCSWGIFFSFYGKRERGRLADKSAGCHQNLQVMPNFTHIWTENSFQSC